MNDTTFVPWKVFRKILGRKLSELCPLVMMVQVDWAEDKILGIEELKVMGSALF